MYQVRILDAASRELLYRLAALPNMETTIERGGGSGISISYKTKEK